MKKITREQARAKKPVAMSIKTSGGERRKFEKPSFKDQLRQVKKKLQRPEATTTKVDIVANGFEYTKTNPLKVEGWLIWRGINDNLVVMPENRRQNERYYNFKFEDGYLFLVNKPNNRYAYFHTLQFHQFLEKYGIHKVLHKEPNGEYQGRNDVAENGTVSVFSFVTDGDWEEFDSSQLRMDEQPINNIKMPTTFIKVQNATFVLFEQVAYKKDNANVEPFIMRQLVTDYDIYSIEPEIAEACRYLDQQLEATSGEQYVHESAGDEAAAAVAE